MRLIALWHSIAAHIFGIIIDRTLFTMDALEAPFSILLDSNNSSHTDGKENH